MRFGKYRQVLALRDVRRVMLIGMVVRIPMFAGSVVLTLHAVSHLDRSYAAAGLLTGLATVALGISGPWRGRRLDRVGLRRALAPSLAVLAVCWAVAPFVGYLPLLVLAVAAGLFEIPGNSVVRQALLTAVPSGQRRSALSLDSVCTEISFMVGPLLGVLLATSVSTQWSLFACEYASLLGGVAMYLFDPPIRAEAAGDERGHGTRSWLGLDVALVLAAGLAATLVLTGTDVGIVAALRHVGHQSWIGGVLAVWGLGSALGGLAYGMLHRSVPVYALLALLALATVPVAFVTGPLALTGLLVVAGFFCAPTITATVDSLSRFVPERVRGEALGWHSGALTTGSAAGAPVAGVAVDHFGAGGGFAVPGLIGLGVAVLAAVLTRRPRRRPAQPAAESALVSSR